jgi:hypothetical protein
LQEFLALQPLSLALQPPLPLQLFWPLQACFSTSGLSAGLSWLLKDRFELVRAIAGAAKTALPDSKPANAAPANIAFVLIAMKVLSCFFKVVTLGLPAGG